MGCAKPPPLYKTPYVLVLVGWVEAFCANRYLNAADRRRSLRERTSVRGANGDDLFPWDRPTPCATTTTTTDIDGAAVPRSTAASASRRSWSRLRRAWRNSPCASSGLVSGPRTPTASAATRP